MKASNQPWFAQAFDAMAGAIESINKLKDMLLGVLAKAASAVGSIIKDPIGFLGNLVSGLRQGFENVIAQIKDMVITQVITAGVKWIIGLLNPASAFVKAAIAIYDIVMFFINSGSQIMDLVNSIKVADGGKTWDYKYVASPEKTKIGEEKIEDIPISQADENWEKAWKAKQTEVHNAMQQFVPRFQNLDPDAKVNIRGSLASGVKMNPKKKASNGEPYVFNPTDFDIDAYVVSDNLFRQALNNNPTAVRNGQIVGSKSKIKEVNTLIRNMREVLANITGNRDTGNVKWQFNVLIRSSENAHYTTKKRSKICKESWT